MNTERLHYILEGRQPKPVADVLVWAQWFESTNRVVAQTQVGELWVSTVFLGLDHSFGHGPPVLFETMVFRGRDGAGEDMWRYSTYDEAEAGHAKVVRRLGNTHLRVVK